MSKEKNETTSKVEDVTAETVTATQGMPEPTTMNYEQRYKLSDTFIEHLKTSLRDVMYDHAAPYYNWAIEHRESVSTADLNGFIKRLESSFTFGAVGDLMRNISTRAGQQAYFIPIPLKTEE